MSNADLEKLLDTSDEWIGSERASESAMSLNPGSGLRTWRRRLQDTCSNPEAFSAEDIDLIVVASVTPDMMFPATACLVQDKLGATNAWGFDLSAACSGFVYALTVGAQFVGAGTKESAGHRQRCQ